MSTSTPDASFQTASSSAQRRRTFRREQLASGSNHAHGHESAHESEHGQTPNDARDVLKRVTDAIAPVWPLADYVAVNPYKGFADRKFLDARRYLRSFSDCETMMPVAYFRQQFQADVFGRRELESAIDELVEDQIEGAESLSAHSICRLLGEGNELAVDESVRLRIIRTVAERYDAHAGGESNWAAAILEEVSKFCAAHYDQGQASWPSPWRQLSLFQAWKSAARYDRRIELLGLRGFREFVAALPPDPEAALVFLLKRAGVPTALWEDLLLCLSWSLPGWSAWAKYKSAAAEGRGEELDDVTGLLALRLAYDVALSECFEFHIDWQSVLTSREASASSALREQGPLVRYACLRAQEIGLRNRLLGGLQQAAGMAAPTAAQTQRKLAQLVFCIDVRSERIRRHIEATSDELETFGFAGFFGLPFEYVPLGDAEGSNQLPVLISPAFQVHEALRTDQEQKTEQALDRRLSIRSFAQVWKMFQSSAVGCFSFVETMGLLYGFKLLGRTVGRGQAGKAAKNKKFAGIAPADRDRLGPDFAQLHAQGITTSRQADMAQSILTNLGLVDGFARLVVFCGHGSQTENNPLAAGLDCGACGGHAGEPNARLAAMLLNQSRVRELLADRGICIPDDVHFLAALHNTTTDAIEFFDTDLVPDSHQSDLAELRLHTKNAGRHTRQERLQLLPGDNENDLLRRSEDWSEVRPEWGLSGNTAFIVGPRSLTKTLDLKGRVFLHSYSAERDPEAAALELIMTAPLVVANWINMQYYASTVDQRHFGSGSKTIHNVVGRFGVFAGNGGDLTTGLPWQSLHDGTDYQHDPVRLLSVIAAPRGTIESIVQRHEILQNLLGNGWLQLVAMDDGVCYRLSEELTWQRLTPNEHPAQAAGTESTYFGTESSSPACATGAASADATDAQPV